ncbi:MAG TPA: endonuclease/exonuclease/phosphatase family protein [Nocardioidaceae bacterium]|nr:endonuclease/exonuclease/phosphatase family protein [Nocardioidaceae bacterium]
MLPLPLFASAAAAAFASVTLAAPAAPAPQPAPAPATRHTVLASPAARTTSRAALPTEFRIASFNVLGASHTRHSKKYASGNRRMRGAVRLLERNGVGVVGLQELQAGQLQRFVELTGGRYDVYPGLSLRRIDSENSIAWDSTVWQPVEEHTVPIPYFGGRLRPMPAVLLRNQLTGMTVWVVNVHTPATNRHHPGQDRWRRKAIADMAALARQLQPTGIPVFLTGDYNERAEAFCPITGTAPMIAARGGTNVDGVCDPMHPWYVDWVFGSRGVGFTDYAEIRGRLDRRTSDHPMIVATAHIDPALFPQAVLPLAPR